MGVTLLRIQVITRWVQVNIVLRYDLELGLILSDPTLHPLVDGRPCILRWVCSSSRSHSL